MAFIRMILFLKNFDLSPWECVLNLALKFDFESQIMCGLKYWSLIKTSTCLSDYGTWEMNVVQAILLNISSLAWVRSWLIRIIHHLLR